MDEKTILTRIVVGIIAYRLFMWWQRQQSQSGPVRQTHTPAQRQPAQTQSKPKTDGISVGFATNVETTDGKLFTADGAALIDVKPAQAGSPPPAPTPQQTMAAQNIVVNAVPGFIGTVPSSLIRDDYQAFARQVEDVLRAQLDLQGFTLKALMLFDPSLEE